MFVCSFLLKKMEKNMKWKTHVLENGKAMLLPGLHRTPLGQLASLSPQHCENCIKIASKNVKQTKIGAAPESERGSFDLTVPGRACPG